MRKFGMNDIDMTLGFWKGPWKVEDDINRGDGDAIYVFPAGGGTAICEVVARDGEGRSNAMVQQAAETTAGLIALTPEMVELMLEISKDVDEIGAPSGQTMQAFSGLLRKINGVLPRKVTLE